MEIKDVAKIRDELKKTLRDINQLWADLNQLLSEYDNQLLSDHDKAHWPGMSKQDLDMDFRDLWISVRIENVLKSCGIRTVRDLLSFCEKNTLTREVNFGTTSLRQLLAAMKSKFGIDFEGKVR